MIGIDEVGRGALAGPLVVAGCYFIENPGFTKGLNDSKRLTAKVREQLDPVIRSNTVFSVVEVSSETIDRIGMTKSIRKAILQILRTMPSDTIIQLDGSFNFLKGTKYDKWVRTEPKADARYPAVMAASIIAKVHRDKVMRMYHMSYDVYGFISNVGYGTASHLDALRRYGPCPIHRRSFNPIAIMVGRD